jgi:hypothetical protein
LAHQLLSHVWVSNSFLRQPPTATFSTKTFSRFPSKHFFSFGVKRASLVQHRKINSAQGSDEIINIFFAITVLDEFFTYLFFPFFG